MRRGHAQFLPVGHTKEALVSSSLTRKAIVGMAMSRYIAAMIRLGIALMLVPMSLFAADAPKSTVPPAFAVVFIDAATEKAIGPFPYDRAVYAKGIEALAEAKARGVVLKFFIDRPKSAEGDAALATSLSKIKVVLQARLDGDEPKPNPLPERFVLKGLARSDAKPLAADSGWLPLPELAKGAYDLAFLDSSPAVELTPLVVRYKGEYVKSLYTAALELALGEKAKIDPAKSLQLGTRKVQLDERCFATIKLPEKDNLEAYSFNDLINHKIAPERLADRVVILGYDGAKMETNKTTIGMVKGHRLFCYQLFSLYRELQPE
jgi:CHASE2 domain-containing sensor protein